MEYFTRLMSFCVLPMSMFTLSSCADSTERFEARQELKLQRIQRRLDRLDAEEQRKQEEKDRKALEQR